MSSRGKLTTEELAEVYRDFDEAEIKWLSEVGASAQRGYPGGWRKFKDFLKAKDLPTAGGEILRLRSDDLMLRREDPARWRFDELALEFHNSLWQFSDLRVPTNTDRGYLRTVQSFFGHHRMDFEFKRRSITKPVILQEKYEITLQDLEAAKKFGNPVERWIFLGGKSLGQRVEDFAYIKRATIEPRLNEEAPVPVDIVTHKKPPKIAHVCLDTDALGAAKDLIAYLNANYPNSDNPYMLSGKKKNAPMYQTSINAAIKRVAEVARASDPSLFRWQEKGQRLSFHGFRAFLTGAFQNAHVDPDLREWMIGHELTDTKKAYTTHQRRKAYMDAEGYLLLPKPRGDLGLTAEQERKVKALVAAGFEERKVLPLVATGMLRKEITKPEEIEDEGETKRKVKVIAEDEIENHLNHGWTFVSILPSGKVLIRKD